MHVLIVGGGLAGLAAATALADNGCRVTLLEARPRLGGRASSFTDSASGLVLDTCQHVSMGCCTNFAYFCRRLGVERFLQPQAALFFMTPDGRVTRWQTAPWPAPLHQLPAFAAAHFLSLREKIRIGRALLALWRDDRSDDPPFAEWLARHGQTPDLIRKFWDVVLVSALNEATENVGFRYARQVFVEAFLKDRRGGIVQVPSVPLVELYGKWVPEYLAQRGGTVRLNTAAEAVLFAEGRAIGVRLRNGETLEADACLLAVPFDRVLTLLPGEIIKGREELACLRHLQTSPITSVHLWYDRPVLPNEPGRRGVPRPLPHVVLVGGVSQWIFNRGRTGPEEYYLQIVISDSHFSNGRAGSPSLTLRVSRRAEGVSHSTRRAEGVSPPVSRAEGVSDMTRRAEGVSPPESRAEGVSPPVHQAAHAARSPSSAASASMTQAILDLVTDEMLRLFPAVKSARLIRSRVIVEKSATFSVRPGVDQVRPPQKTTLPGLYLAGDWTRTGWPATMEGAVRSGYLAAEAILHEFGRSARLLQPDLDGVIRRP